MTNELIFILTAFGIFFFVFCCFFWGRRWLHAAIAVNLIVISTFGAEVISIFGRITNVGNIFYAAVFFAGQMLVEHYGKKEGRKSIWLGLTFVIFFIVVAQNVTRYAPIPESVPVASAIHFLFASTPRIAAASLLAYLCSQSLNIWLYGYLRSIREKQIWLRITLANFFGQGVDSIIFFSLAFAGVLPESLLLNAIITGFAIKFLIGFMSIPFAYLSYKIKVHKEILEQEAEAMILGIGDGIIITNDKGEIIMTNRAFTEMLGWNQKEVIGKAIADVIQRQDEEGNKITSDHLMIHQALAGKKIASLMPDASYFTRKNGTRFPVTITVTPMFIDNRIIGAVEVFRDTTKEKEIDKIRTDFVSLASHQLRTPLSGMRWIIETLMDKTIGSVNKRQEEYLKDLYRMNSRLIQLVSDMLNVLHIQSGTITINKDVFGLDSLHKEITITNRDAAKKKHITLESNLAQSPAIKVVSDFRLAKNILDSFISNAINYSDPASTIQIHCQEKPSEVLISVKDNGIGIPEDEQGKIFEKFYRASNAKEVNPSGTGLGLYIAKSLAEQIGAKVAFKSSEGNGSTFSLILPRHHDEKAPPVQARPPR